MTDEQIIIDGVDVSGCKEYIWALSHVCNLVNGRTDKFECNYYPNCYFKQLARKTQECEELKEENQKLEMQLCNECGERDDYNIPCKMIRDLDYGLQMELEENARYRKALEEIEKIVSGNYEILDPLAKQQISSIVNKAKGDINEAII